MRLAPGTQPQMVRVGQHDLRCVLSRKSCGVSPLTVAAVPTGMKRRRLDDAVRERAACRAARRRRRVTSVECVAQRLASLRSSLARETYSAGGSRFELMSRCGARMANARRHACRAWPGQLEARLVASVDRIVDDAGAPSPPCARGSDAFARFRDETTARRAWETLRALRSA